MLNPKTFVCDRRCGECCVKYTVKLSKKDIGNIKKSGYNEEFFVDIDQFMPEPGKFVLKKKENRWCVFLTRDKKKEYTCRVYNARPSVCAKYPFLKKKVYSCKPITFLNKL